MLRGLSKKRYKQGPIQLTEGSDKRLAGQSKTTVYF